MPPKNSTDATVPKTDDPGALGVQVDIAGGYRTMSPDEAAIELLRRIAEMQTAIASTLATIADRIGTRSMPHGMTVLVTWRDIVKARGCKRSAAYRHLRAAGGRGGTATVEQWNEYAARTWGQEEDQITWDARAKKAIASAGRTASRTQPSTSTDAPSSVQRGRAPKPRPNPFLMGGDARREIAAVKPRRAPR